MSTGWPTRIPKLVDELIPKLMSLGEVQKVLQQLLREQVSIRDLGTILETLVETAATNKNPVILVEAARHALGRALIRPLLDEQRAAESGDARQLASKKSARASTQQNAQLLAGRSDADLGGAPGARRTARDARRPDRDGASGAAVRFAGPVLSAARSGAVYSQDCCDFALGDSSDDAGDVAGVGAMKMLNVYTV